MTSASYYRLLANHRPVDGDDAKDTAHSAGGQGRQRRRLVRDANDARVMLRRRLRGLLLRRNRPCPAAATAKGQLVGYLEMS